MYLTLALHCYPLNLIRTIGVQLNKPVKPTPHVSVGDDQPGVGVY